MTESLPRLASESLPRLASDLDQQAGHESFERMLMELPDCKWPTDEEILRTIENRLKSSNNACSLQVRARFVDPHSKHCLLAVDPHLDMLHVWTQGQTV